MATETVGRGEARVGLQHAATLFDHGCRDMRGDGGALGVRIVSARSGSGFCGGPKLRACAGASEGWTPSSVYIRLLHEHRAGALLQQVGPARLLVQLYIT